MADTFADVSALSDSDASPDEIHAGTGSTSPIPQEHGQTKQKRRRQQCNTAAKTASDESTVRAMLGKPKCHCKRQCLAQFTDDASFRELMSFRSTWSEMHKLDQDTEAFWMD